ncbi:MAG TPA: DUF4214 domain-containing protein [Pseudomonas sp.]|uniref:DUF4214 domain-containing protein n=1 Tax=Pseudomonas sp. TaxID=306 RepID=UPI002ED8282B
MSTQSNIAELYTAFFNRAPDADGLAYWVGELDAGKISLEQIAKNWVESQPEGQAKYPDSLSTSDFIAAIYDNVLSRTADTAGLAYWQGQLDSGSISRDVFVAAIINGAKSNTSAQGQLDATLLANKATVGIAFADKGLNDVALAAKVLTSVSADTNTLTATLDLIKLVPATTAGQTPAVLTALNTAVTNVANLIKTAPGELGDLVTYLNAVAANVSTATNLTTLFTSINTKVVAAQTNPAALDNPATQATGDVATATPVTTPTTPTAPATFTVTNGTAEHVGQFTVGNANGNVKVTLSDGEYVFKPANGTEVKVSTTLVTQGLAIGGITLTLATEVLNELRDTFTFGDSSSDRLVFPGIITGNSHAKVALTDTTLSAGQLNFFDEVVNVPLDVSKLTSINGTAVELIEAYGSSTLEVIGLGNEAVSVNGTSSVEQLTQIAAKTSGIITAASITDSAAALAADTIFVQDAAFVVVNDAATVAQLTTIASKGDAAITAASITDSAAALAADTVYVANATTVTVDDTATVAQLTQIAAKTDATLVYTSVTDGVLALIADTIFVQDAESVVVSGTATVAQLTTIASKGDAAITAASITDSAEALAADTTFVAGAEFVVVTNAATVAELTTIASKGDAAITAAWIADSAATLAADTTFVKDAESVYVNDAATVAQLTTIASKGDAAITAASITDSAEALAADTIFVQDAESVVVSGTATVAQLTTIASKGDAAIMAASITDSAAALAADTVYVANATTVTVDGTATVAQLTQIDAKTDATLVYASVTDTAAALAADAALNLGAGDLIVGKVVVISGVATLAQVTAIKGADATSVSYSAVTDTAAALAADAALNTGDGDLIVGKTVVISDAATLAQVTAIKAVAPSVSYTAVTDTAAHLVAGAANLTAKTVTVTDAITLDQLATIRDAAATSVSYTAVTDTAAALAADATLNNGGQLVGTTVVISDAATVAQVTAIKNVPDTISVSYAAVTDTAAALAANTGLITGKIVVVNGAATLDQITTIKTAVPGLTYTTVTDTAALLAADAALNSGNGNLITGKSVVISNAATLAQVTTIKAAVPTVSYTTVTDTAAALAADAALNSGNGNLIVGKTVVISDFVNLAQVTGIKAVVSTVSYTAVTDTAAVLAADAALNSGVGNLIVGKVVVISGVATLAQVTAIKAVAPTVSYTAVTDTAAHLATDAALNTGAGNLIVGKVVVISDAATLAQVTAIKAVAPTVSYTAVTDTAAVLAADAALNTGAGNLIVGKTVVISDAATVAQVTAIKAVVPAVGYTAVTDTAAVLAADAAFNSGGGDLIVDKVVVISGVATLAQVTAIKGSDATSVSYTAVTDTAAVLAADAALNSGNGNLIVGKTLIISDAATVAQVTAIKAAVPTVSYTAVTDTAALLAAGVANLTGKTVTVTDAATLDQLTTIKAAATSVSYTAVTDTAAHLATDAALNNGAGNLIVGKVVVISDAATLAQVTAIKAAVPTVSYAAVTDTAAVLAADAALNTGAGNLIVGKLVVISDAATVAQVTAIKAVVPAVGYTAVTDTAAALAADAALNSGAGNLITGKTVVVSDAATIDQITAIKGAVSTATYTAISDTAGHLITDAGTFVTGAINVTITDTVNLTDLATIDGHTTGKVTVINLTDSAAHLVPGPDGAASQYIGEGSNVTVAGTVTIAQLKAIDVANGTTGTLTYTTISDTIENLTALGASAYYGSTINVTVTDAVTVAQLIALDNLNASISYDVDLTDTASALASSDASVFLTNRNVTVSDDATIAQLNSIDTQNGTGTVTYTKIKDDAAVLVADAGARILVGTAVTVNDAATIQQLLTIDNLILTTPIYTKIADTAANLAADTAYVKSLISVTVTDTAVAAANLVTVNAHTDITVDATAVTAIMGNFADVQATHVSGIHLSGNESVSITDSAAQLTAKTLNANAGFNDQLHVGVASDLTNLSGFSGFEDIYLAGSNRAANVITLGNESGITVHASAAVSVTMGTGEQNFISSAGNDTVTLSAGSTFVFGQTAVANGNDLIKGFVATTANVSGSTLDFGQFFGGSYAVGNEVVSSTSQFGGAANTVTLVDGSSVAANVNDGLAVQNVISLSDFTSTYLSQVSGKEVLVAFNNSLHTAKVYFVDSALGGSATTVDTATDIVLVGTVNYSGDMTATGLHTANASIG